MMIRLISTSESPSGCSKKTVQYTFTMYSEVLLSMVLLKSGIVMRSHFCRIKHELKYIQFLIFFHVNRNYKLMPSKLLYQILNMSICIARCVKELYGSKLIPSSLAIITASGLLFWMQEQTFVLQRAKRNSVALHMSKDGLVLSYNWILDRKVHVYLSTRECVILRIQIVLNVKKKMLNKRFISKVSHKSFISYKRQLYFETPDIYRTREGMNHHS
jgi:hypothetical protein